MPVRTDIYSCCVYVDVLQVLWHSSVPGFPSITIFFLRFAISFALFLLRVGLCRRRVRSILAIFLTDLHRPQTAADSVTNVIHADF